MINQLILEGRVVKTETKNTKKGNKYFSLVIAYDTVFKEKGKWEKKTNFIKGYYWKSLSQKLSESIKPGTPLTIEGSLEQVSINDGDNKKTFNYINVDKIHFNSARKSKKLKF